MERFAGHTLVRRLDGGCEVEFHLAAPLVTSEERRVLVRWSRELDRMQWPPWADPGLARVLLHPNIVRMFESAVFEDAPYLLFEHVAGVDLRELLVHGPLPAHVACLIVREVCRGLAGALGAQAPNGTPLKWVHGSICPREIHLSTNGEVKVSGFGLMRLKPEPKGDPLREMVDERLLFLSPEQAAGVSGDSPEPPTDVFRVGAILHSMLTGRPLMESKTPLEYIRALIETPRDTFSTASDSISPALRGLLERMLAWDATSRPQDASAVLRGLEGAPEMHDAESAREELRELVRQCRQLSSGAP